MQQPRRQQYPSLRKLVAVAVLAVAALVPVRAGAVAPVDTPGTTAVDLPVIAGAPVGGNPTGGYLMAADDGSVHTFRPASRNSSPGVARPAGRPVVDIAATPSGNGYWLTTTHGDIYTFGDARFFGSTGNVALNQPIVGMAATPSGAGYWLVASDGGMFTFGDARFYGSTGALRLNQPIVGMASSPTGRGYWLVAADGGIFTFGDATFLGSTGNLRLNRPIVGMAAAPSGGGYWLVASDGGIFTFGDARFLGSTGGIRLNRPVVGMSPTPTGGGYWLAASDGGVFTFGDARFEGAMESSLLDGRIVGLVPQGGDVRAPVLHELSFGPRVVDTGQGEAQIRFRARVTDDMSGVTQVGVGFRSGSGQTAGVMLDWPGRTGGDELDEAYTGVMTLPKNAAQGLWTISTVTLADKVGNRAEVSGRTLAEAGYPTTFEQTAPGDAEAPYLRALSVTPDTIDTSTGPATVTVRVRVTDDWSGNVTGSLALRFANRNQINDVVYENWRLVSGDARDGIYEAPLLFPAGSAHGRWHFSVVSLSDEAGNRRTQWPKDVPAPDNAAGFTQVGAGDSDPPQLVSWSMTPTTVDTSTQSATIVVTARVIDRGVGVPTERNDRWGGGGFSFISPSQQQVHGSLMDTQIVAGDRHDATYRSTVTVPRHSEQGTWMLRNVFLVDRVGNQVSLDGNRIAGAGYPTTFEVVRTEDVQVRP